MRSSSRRAPSPTAPGEASEAFPELTIHLGLCATRKIRPDHDDEVEARAARGLLAAEALSQEATCPIPHHGASELSTRRDPETVLRPPVRQGDHHEQPALETPAPLEGAVEVPAHAQTPLALEPLTHDPARLPNSGRQSLPTFLPPPLQHQTAALGPHPNQEPVGPLPLPVAGLKRPLHCCSSLSVPRRGSRQDETGRVMERAVFCQSERPDAPCTLPRPYASVTGLRTANNVEPPMTPGALFPQLLKSLCKRGLGDIDGSPRRILSVRYC